VIQFLKWTNTSPFVSNSVTQVQSIVIVTLGIRLMVQRILYLFNSASRAAYKDNLYRILALPVGAKVQFRYSLSYSVPPDFRERLQGHESLIVFVDRFSERAYTYYPIRKGKVLDGYRMQNRLIIECRLSEYCSVDSPEEFTNNLKESVEGVPELRDGDPNTTSDGYYVQLGNEFKDGLITNDEIWSSIVENIYQTDAFREDPTAFLKLSVKRETGTKDVTLRGRDGAALLKSENTYTLKVFYYDPDEGNIEKYIAFSFKDPLEKYGPDRYRLGAISDLLDIQFKASKALGALRTSVDIVVESQNTEKYRLTLPIRISSWTLLGGILFYAGIGFLTFIVPRLWNIPNDDWSLVFEAIRYLIIVRLFIKFGTSLSLPFKSWS
jgi:hypothetical protein